MVNDIQCTSFTLLVTDSSSYETCVSFWIAEDIWLLHVNVSTEISTSPKTS